jgi:hypothetical protein
LFEHDLFGKPVPTFPDHALDAAKKFAAGEHEKGHGGERGYGGAIHRPSPPGRFAAFISIAECRCSGLIFLCHCYQPPGGASMLHLDLVSGPPTTTGMVQKCTLLCLHRAKSVALWK